MNNIYHSEDVNHEGTKYRVQYHVDDILDAPWDNSDGHGKVNRVSVDRYTGHIAKKPGQVVLYRGDRNEYSYLYDFADAMKTAKADGWNAKPYNAPNKALRAVNADMEYLKGYITGDWHYIGIVIFPLTADGDEIKSKSVSLWGIESCSDEYIKETIQELLSEFENIEA